MLYKMYCDPSLEPFTPVVLQRGPYNCFDGDILLRKLLSGLISDNAFISNFVN